MRIVAAVLLVSPSTALAGTLSPWGLQTSAGETWLTPYLFVDAEGVANNTYLSIGLGERFDLIGGVGVGYHGGFEPGVVEAMPRVFLSPNVGLVVRVGSVPGASQLEVGPEVHASWSAGPLAFTTNVGWRPTVGPASALGQAFAILAPELVLGDFSLFAEVNPSLALESGAAEVSVVPGFGLAVGDHSVALGSVLPVSDLDAWTLGAWYSVRLGAIAR